MYLRERSGNHLFYCTHEKRTSFELSQSPSCQGRIHPPEIWQDVGTKSATRGSQKKKELHGMIYKIGRIDAVKRSKKTSANTLLLRIVAVNKILHRSARRSPWLSVRNLNYLQ